MHFQLSQWSLLASDLLFHIDVPTIPLCEHTQRKSESHLPYDATGRCNIENKHKRRNAWQLQDLHSRTRGSKIDVLAADWKSRLTGYPIPTHCWILA